MKILLPFVPRTANEIRRKPHWGNKHAEKRKMVTAIVDQAGFGPFWPVDGKLPPGRQVEVEVIVYREKLQDPDNLIASLKTCIDSLKDAGHIFDDSARWIRLTARERKCPRKEQRTEILIGEQNENRS